VSDDKLKDGLKTEDEELREALGLWLYMWLIIDKILSFIANLK
jgi:hypothetical protein